MKPSFAPSWYLLKECLKGKAMLFILRSKISNQRYNSQFFLQRIYPWTCTSKLLLATNPGLFWRTTWTLFQNGQGWIYFTAWSWTRQKGIICLKNNLKKRTFWKKIYWWRKCKWCMVFALNYFVCLFVFFPFQFTFSRVWAHKTTSKVRLMSSGWLLTLFRGALIVRLIFGEQKGREMRLQKESICSDFNLKLTG